MRLEIQLNGFVLLLAAGVIALGLRAAAAQESPATSAAPGPAAPAAPAVARPTEAVPAGGCVTSDCHASVKQFKVLHGPVNVNACEACHTPADPKAHTFTLSQNKNELCLFCHQIEQPAGSTVHAPVKEGDCLSCHDPHGGTTSAFIRAGGVRATCNQCHADVVGQKKAVHGPVAAGACESCHKPHVSQFDNLLIMEKGRDLCFSCHAEMQRKMGQVQFQHKAVEADCGACHDPHASDHTMQIVQRPVELCTSCHQDVKAAALGATHKHGVVVQGDACLNCHTAHGGDLASLMKREPVKLCMSCHAEPVQAGERTIGGVKQVLAADAIKHGPLRDGNCSGCHTSHGAENPSLLAKAYPAAFYQPFEIDKYALCFSCHDQQLVLTRSTATLTGFRNGNDNLHFVHVNKTDKGRNCRACHETHASTNELHVRDSVPFGKWQMPINFKKTDTGGSCSPGCHKPYDYDREKPVTYTAAGAANGDG